MFRSADEMEQWEQWEVEMWLGQLLETAIRHRKSAELSEKSAAKSRQREAEAVAAASECRKRLGLADEPIGRVDGHDDA